MTKDEAIKIILNYLYLGHELKKSDFIFVLGGRDIRVAEHAAKLYLDGWAPAILFSGSGSIHNHLPGREKFVDTSEAEVFAEVAKQKGVPDSAIMIENKSQNTGENFEFARKILEQRGINSKSAIVVGKPYLERRAYATGKKWWPEIELTSSSMKMSSSEYAHSSINDPEYWIHSIVGEIHRIKSYPSKGFIIEQEIPDEVNSACEYLVGEGYQKRLPKL